MPSVSVSIGNGKRSTSAREKSSVRTQPAHSIGTSRYLQAFQKVRDCSHVHDHLGTSAKIQVRLHFAIVAVLVDRMREKRRFSL